MLVAFGSLVLGFDGINILWWLIIGLIAGALAGMVMRGGGYGIIGDIVVGLIGALVGGFLANAIFGINSGGNVLVMLIIAFIGACIFIAILRALTGGFGGRGRRGNL